MATGRLPESKTAKFLPDSSLAAFDFQNALSQIGLATVVRVPWFTAFAPATLTVLYRTILTKGFMELAGDAFGSSTGFVNNGGERSS